MVTKNAIVAALTATSSKSAETIEGSVSYRSSRGAPPSLLTSIHVTAFRTTHHWRRPNFLPQVFSPKLPVGVLPLPSPPTYQHHVEIPYTSTTLYSCPGGYQYISTELSISRRLVSSCQLYTLLPSFLSQPPFSLLSSHHLDLQRSRAQACRDNIIIWSLNDEG